MTERPPTRQVPVLWVITDQLPYPARNGITLPIFHYLEGLAASYRLRLVLLTDIHNQPQSCNLAENEARFGVILQIDLHRRDPLARLWNEIRGKEMFQHGWEAPYPIDVSGYERPDAILVSPMSAVAKWRRARVTGLRRIVPALAAVNDCTTAEYYFRGQAQVGAFRYRLKGAIDRFRSRLIGPIEQTLLAPYTSVFLQTQRDRELMARLVSDQTAARVVLAPNGVAESYLAIEPRPAGKVVFVGELSGEYASIVHWLVKEVWPLAAPANARAELVIVGRGASPELRLLMRGAARVVHLEYVPDLSTVYKEAMIAISPVFKGFGLINKTLEAMACGVPVVGGAEAFNGIAGFQPDIHGVVCGKRSTAEFAKALTPLMASRTLRDKTGRAGRLLVAGQFHWPATVQRLSQEIRQALVHEHLDP